MKHLRLAASWEPLVFLLAAALWLAPVVVHPTGFLFWQGGGYSDLLITHYPNAQFLRRSLLEWGQLPLWNPMILSGAPFAGDPLAGIVYLPNWLAVILPGALGFNLLFALHLAWAGWGMARFLRSEGLGDAACVLGGLVFGGAPKLIGHIGLGHLGLVSAVAWTPWLLLATGKAVRADAQIDRRWLARAALAGLILGVVFLADPRWFVPAGLVSLAYGLRRIAHSHAGMPRAGRRILLLGLLASGFALGTAASLALPMQEFLRLSTRAHLAAGETTSLSLPVARLLGVLFPDLGGTPEWTAYAGVAALILGLVAIAGRAKGSLFWAGLVLSSWVLALGDQTPLYAAVRAVIPGVGSLRVPPRFLFLASLGTAALAGAGLDRLLHILDGRQARRVRLAVTGLAAVLVLLVAGAKIASGSIPAGWAGSAVLGCAAAALAFLSLRPAGLPAQAPERAASEGARDPSPQVSAASGRPRARWLAAAWILLAVVDLGWANAGTLDLRPAEAVLTERGDLAEDLAQAWPGDRIFSPSYSVPQQTASTAGLELADGVNPLQLSAFVDYMAAATGFDARAYSVTLPPFPSGDPVADWGAEIDSRQLGLLNIAAVVSDYPLEAAGLTFAGFSSGANIYQNEEVRPRAWVEEDLGGWRPVESIHWTPNRIALRALGPGTLVLSEIVYPGWHARVDGAEVPIQPFEDLLRSVPLPDGEHEVVFLFRPWSAFLGAGVSLGTLLALLVLWARR